MAAVWSETSGLEPSPQDKLEMRTDLTGVLIRGTSETEPPFSQTRPAGESSFKKKRRQFLASKKVFSASIKR